MNTQVIFKIDKNIKAQAQKKAKARGLTFSDVLKMATYAYVENSFEPALVLTERFKPAVGKMIAKSIANIKAGKNLSPAFTNADDFMNYLEKEIKKERSKKVK